jgi:hypothetical protein
VVWQRTIARLVYNFWGLAEDHSWDSRLMSGQLVHTVSARMRHLNSWTVSIGPLERVDKQGQLQDELWSEKKAGWSVFDNSNGSAEYALAYWGVATAYISISRKEIIICPVNADVPYETLEHLILDQVLPRTLAHDGHLVLHAGAVTKDGSTIIFIGPSGRGKSTLAGSFLEAVWTLLSDDSFVVSQVGDVYMGVAVYKSMRLKPDSIDNLFMVRPELKQVCHYTSKQRVAFCQSADQDIRAMAIPALFFLAPEPPDKAIGLRRMSIAETCMGVIANSFSLDATDAGLAAKKLVAASDLSAIIPAFELSFPRDYTQLPHVHAVIQNQLAILKNSGDTPVLEEA